MADHTSHRPGYADPARRYRLDSRIATGGMGEVWHATDTVLDRPVAVKVLKQEHADDAVFRSRFETEAQHAAGLHHPGVAQVYDFGAGDAEQAPYLVMEYVHGKPLSAMLRSGQPMDPAAASQLVAAIGDALGAAHARGIVHRDVKPANILVTDGRGVKITDFGIARAADSVALTRTGEVLGTPQYISPEQAEGKQATPASDVYSLAAVAYECLVGQRPFRADSPVATAVAHLRQPVPQLPSTVPPALAAVVRRAMAKSPEERYADGAAFAAAVRQASSAPRVEADPATKVMAAPMAGVVTASASGPWRTRARSVPVPVWAATGVLVVVVAVAALAATTTGGGGDTPASSTSRHTVSHAAVRSSGATAVTSSPSQQGPTEQATQPPPKPAKPHHDHHDHHHHDKGQDHEHGKGHQ